VVSSVVRSAHKGESHGGVYLVDLGTEKIEQVIDWNDPTINWEGRGADRGLRGIAFHGDLLYLAASDEVFVYDKGFQQRASVKNRYLKHCHEIAIDGNTLYMTSTGFDSVLEYDLVSRAFRRGYALRFSRLWRGRRTIGLRPAPAFRVFDPNGDDGPTPGDTAHVNNVHAEGGALFVCGTGLGNVWRIEGKRLSRYARVPYGSHNARPFRSGALLNHTATDRIAYVDRRGRVLMSFPLKTYEEHELQNAPSSKDLARQAFGRGLALADDDLIIGGSSPSTVTVYQIDPPSILKSINLTMDVRNAVHGLELWPFDRGSEERSGAAPPPEQSRRRSFA
jgi:hypothetical protein